MPTRQYLILHFIISLCLLFLPFQMVSAGEQAESDLYMAATDSHSSPPGSKEPEGLEPESPSTFAFGWDVTLASKYLFQGVDYSEGKPVVQPEVILTVKDFSAILWFNHDLHTKDSNEFDLYLQYDLTREYFSLTAGYAHLNYPHREEWDPSQEVFIALSYNAPLNPSLSVHYDFDAGKGAYYTLGFNHNLESLVSNLTIGTNLFYQDNYYENSGFPSMEVNGSYEYSIGSFTATPSISYFFTRKNGDFPENCDCDVSDTWLFSINVGQSF